MSDRMIWTAEVEAKVRAVEYAHPGIDDMVVAFADATEQATGRRHMQMPLRFYAGVAVDRAAKAELALARVKALHAQWADEAKTRGPEDMLYTAGVADMLGRALAAPVPGMEWARTDGPVRQPEAPRYEPMPLAHNHMTDQGETDL